MHKNEDMIKEETCCFREITREQYKAMNTSAVMVQHVISFPSWVNLGESTDEALRLWCQHFLIKERGLLSFWQSWLPWENIPLTEDLLHSSHSRTGEEVTQEEMLSVVHQFLLGGCEMSTMLIKAPPSGAMPTSTFVCGLPHHPLPA